MSKPEEPSAGVEVGSTGMAGPEGSAQKVPIRDRRKLRDRGTNQEKGGVQAAPAAAGDGSPSAFQASGQEASGPAGHEAGTPASEPSGATVSETIPTVAEELAKAREEAASYREDLQRLKAEFDNYRKRTIKEQSRLVENAAVRLIGELLGVMDDFELAVAAAEETRDFDRMLKGVEMVYGELKEVLGAAGLEPIDAKGKPFDPMLHEAALEAPGDGSGVNVVTEVLRNGYKFKGSVLRPAMVKVTQDASGGQH
ncbi:MAG TPA: nucleotide exchange factor GrpE [Actinomycetota bacterium]|nr:nucleotide exchange factor GrpE [Actinomycetota bacterium]